MLLGVVGMLWATGALGRVLSQAIPLPWPPMSWRGYLGFAAVELFWWNPSRDLIPAGLFWTAVAIASGCEALLSVISFLRRRKVDVEAEMAKLRL